MTTLHGFFHLTLFGPAHLQGALEGWRWIRTPTGERVEDVVNWTASWVIFADRSGDALFVDTDTHLVFGSVQGEHAQVAPDLPAFLAALTDGMTIELDDYQTQVRAADWSVLPAFETAVRTAVVQRLGEEPAAGFMAFFFG